MSQNMIFEMKFLYPHCQIFSKNGFISSIFTKTETPGCTVEKLCRPHKSFGLTACLRDFYFELFDLQKNFGEKRFCPVEHFKFPGNKKTFKPYKDISDALGVQSRTSLGGKKVFFISNCRNKKN